MGLFLRAVTALVTLWYFLFHHRKHRSTDHLAETVRKVGDEQLVRREVAEGATFAAEQAGIAAEDNSESKAEEIDELRADDEQRARDVAQGAARAAEGMGSGAENENRRKEEERVERRSDEDQHSNVAAEAADGRQPSAAFLSDHHDKCEPEGDTPDVRSHVFDETDVTDGSASRSAPQYRAPIGGRRITRQASQRSGAAKVSRISDSDRNVVLPIEVRLLVERGDYCRVTLLPKRVAGLTNELTVRTATGTLGLVARQDDWYQDVSPEDLGTLLVNGVTWKDEASGCEWLLSGREIFVLAAGTAHRGAVSCTRLALGRDHTILCTVPRLDVVELVLRQAGCDAWTHLDENDGAPRGWIILRHVVPMKPVPLADSSDILNVIRPLPKIEISLEKGIRLEYSTWLVSHPPNIRVYGDPTHIERVLIDGYEAAWTGDAGYTAPGWDSLGSHQVWCKGSSKSYSLVCAEPSSRPWTAFSFDSRVTRGPNQIVVCGPLVRVSSDREDEDVAPGQILQVTPRNPVLIGAAPGQVLATRPRTDLRDGHSLVSSPFAPVWAIPAQPLMCEKQTNRVHLIGELLSPGYRRDGRESNFDDALVRRWWSVIREAARKGLAVEPETPEAIELWVRYKRYARGLWRMSR
jgi:hypothetical protein